MKKSITAFVVVAFLSAGFSFIQVGVGRTEPITLLWDEAIIENNQIVGYKPWVLFEG